ncbi:winged helix-turn-helix transcriptional regulator [Agrobacterium radiobacter]|uniref:winged helix-turn-helix transcriptional regulator n=1 Tax=Agrobacterium radiobacter TaxID=362 RepID=UPI0004CEA3E4|nr:MULTISPECIES: helix-turn-helix domain-containing protein [Agrobacterium tumefaciens complex]KAB0459216.1 helix-turn-helix transcriptional regulator [Agrobacterium tumefaciens]KWT75421.1 ArsR family transcriptional regulator [Agrobacterium radiobacter]NIB11632.1 helix-turn-helix transcriptional regulator [Agrobacterium radiobacter]OOO33142.1 ArsR family transcriptional regulator [Agrobacterium radiobacter]
MNEAITHLKVPMNERSACLGPDGSVAHVGRVLGMLTGRWKLPILFRLFASPSMRSSQFLREMSGISQKVLTQHLRDLEADGLVERRDFHEQPRHVEYRLTRAGRELLPALLAIREYSRDHPTAGKG